MHHNHKTVHEETLSDDQKMHHGSRRLLLVFRSLPDKKELSLAVALIAPKNGPLCRGIKGRRKSKKDKLREAAGLTFLKSA